MKRRKIIRWKPIPDTNKMYWVSSNGKVHSRRDGKVLLKKLQKHGETRDDGNQYLCVSVICKNGKQKRFLVHRLVGLLFVPNPNNYPLINHKDGIKWHNYYKNLEWGNNHHNMMHSSRILGNQHGSYGEEHPNAKLSEGDVRKIRDIIKHTKETNVEIGKRFNVGRMAIKNIRRNKTWKQLI